MEPAIKNFLEVLKNETDKMGKVITDVSNCENEEQMGQIGTEFLKNVSGSISRCVQLVDTDNISAVIEEVKKARAAQSASNVPVSSVSSNTNDPQIEEKGKKNEGLDDLFKIFFGSVDTNKNKIQETLQTEGEKLMEKINNCDGLPELIKQVTQSVENQTSTQNSVQKTEEKQKEEREGDKGLLNLLTSFFGESQKMEDMFKKSQIKWMVTQYRLLDEALEKLKEQVKNLPERERNEFWCEYHGIKFQPVPQEERLSNIENKLQELLSKVSK